MKISIIGTGAVGGYFGARLARAGNDVIFLARGGHLNAIREKGLTVKSILGDFRIEDVRVTDKITDMEKPDLAIIAVKAWQIREVRNDLSQILHPGSMIIPLQNGVLAADELAEKIDRGHILGGLCRIMSKVESPGVINHSGLKPVILFGEPDGSMTRRTVLIQQTFRDAGIESKISEDIESDLWKKFIGICVSGLLAVTRTTYGELRETKETRQMMIELLNEVFLLSQKAGIRIDDGFVEKTVSAIDNYPYDSTSSLTRDVWEGKPSEIEYQNGTVVRLAAKRGIDVPVNRFIYHCILPMERKARRMA